MKYKSLIISAGIATLPVNQAFQSSYRLSKPLSTTHVNGPKQTLIRLTDSDDTTLITQQVNTPVPKRVQALKLLGVTISSFSLLSVTLPFAKQLAIYGDIRPFDIIKTSKSVLLITALSTILPKCLDTLFKLDLLKGTPHNFKLILGATVRHFCLWPVEQDLVNSFFDHKIDSKDLIKIRFFHCLRELLTLKCDTQKIILERKRDKFKNYSKLATLQACCEKNIIETQTYFPTIIVSRFLFLLFLRECIQYNTKLSDKILKYVMTKGFLNR